MKTSILTKMMKFPKLASFTNKHFKGLSLAFTIIFLVTFFGSLAYTAYGIYNLVTIGTCDPQHPDNCIFTPMLSNNSLVHDNICVITGDFVEFYGEGCPHCERMVPIVAKVENETGVTFQKLEIWNNETNKNSFLMHADAIERDCGMLGVPSFYATKTDKVICGEISADKLRQFIRDNG